jgi:hypothetical protein
VDCKQTLLRTDRLLFCFYVKTTDPTVRRKKWAFDVSDQRHVTDQSPSSRCHDVSWCLCSYVLLHLTDWDRWLCTPAKSLTQTG